MSPHSLPSPLAAAFSNTSGDDILLYTESERDKGDRLKIWNVLSDPSNARRRILDPKVLYHCSRRRCHAPKVMNARTRTTVWAESMRRTCTFTCRIGIIDRSRHHLADGTTARRHSTWEAMTSSQRSYAVLIASWNVVIAVITCSG
ncbi:hypothetical protein BD309DRAFT_362613 [Dichomitus squalens]|nr:hypothetical protein BD309DRAFT_362613 [Dichomitus squalens]